MATLKDVAKERLCRKVCKLDSSMIMMGEKLEKSAFRPLFIYNSY